MSVYVVMVCRCVVMVQARLQARVQARVQEQQASVIAAWLVELASAAGGTAVRSRSTVDSPASVIARASPRSLLGQSSQQLSIVCPPATFVLDMRPLQCDC